VRREGDSWVRGESGSLVRGGESFVSFALGEDETREKLTEVVSKNRDPGSENSSSDNVCSVVTVIHWNETAKENVSSASRIMIAKEEVNSLVLETAIKVAPMQGVTAVM